MNLGRRRTLFQTQQKPYSEEQVIKDESYSLSKKLEE